MPYGCKSFISMNKRNSHPKVDNLLLAPIKSVVFLYLLLLNMVANLAYLLYGKGVFAIVSMVVLAAMTAYIECGIYKLLRRKTIQIGWLMLLVIIHNVLIVTDYFLLSQFHMVIGQDVVDIIAETNMVEIRNFIDAYMTWSSLTIWILSLLLLNLLIIWLSRLLIRLPYVWPAICCVITGFCIMTYCVCNFALYRNGMAIPQYHSLTRLGYSLYIMDQRIHAIDELRDICRMVKATSVYDNKPTIVVVIGESHSVCHSSLYGYKKNTNPLLQRRVEGESLYVYDNVVTTSCLTHAAMKSIFSLDSLNEGGKPLFPACFKAAGYKTALYDNQYFVGSGVNFLANKDLSEQLFDFRNSKRFQYDMDMIETINPHEKPSLYIIHLWGQHYSYGSRYPDSFRYFKADDYDKDRWTEKQREIIANYDNATLYNDYVIDQIIRRFEDKNCCLVYFSDHGEEIYEESNYMGHGNAEHSSGFEHQIRVPLLIWLSPTFSRPELKEKLFESLHCPLMTDDVSHFLLDIAGIETAAFSPSRSFINNHYNFQKPRIILHSIDYDKKMKSL